MTQQAFEILFVVTLVAPPLTVLIGLLLLVIPRFHARHGEVRRAGVPAHV
jgi:hypothetical protein